MAKKKTTAGKKAAAAGKKTTTAKKKPAAAGKKTTTAKKKPAAAGAKALAERQRERTTFDFSTAPKEIQELTTAHEPHIDLLPPHRMEVIMTELNSIIRDFQSMSDNNLTLAQRRRKFGAGIRNYGFIEKVADLAAANPQFAQFFNPVDLRNAIKNVDMCRDLVLALQGFQRMVSNSMLIYSDDAFTMSLIFYNMVRTMSRRGDPQAIQLFRTLLPFFTSRNRRASEEPTAKEIEHDVHALLHGTKDGKIVIENIKPAAAKGVRKVVDETFKGSASFKETEEGKFNE